MSFRYLSDYELSVISAIDDMGPLAKPVDLIPLLKQLKHLYGVNQTVTQLIDSARNFNDGDCQSSLLIV